MSRPLVLVYQDLQQASVEPITPDLNSVIAGPAYVIKDYPDDAASILLSSAYGQLEQPAGGTDVFVPPVANVAALTVAAMPGNAAGAIVDRASVRVFLKAPHVVVGSTHGVGVAVGTKVTTSTTTGLENKLVFTGGSPDLVAAGVKVGDTVVLTDSGGTHTITRTVMSVGEPTAAGVVTNVAACRVTANVPASGWTADANGEARFERTLADTEYVDAVGDVITWPQPGTDTLVINGGITLSVDAVARPVAYAGVYVAYRALRQDLAADVDSVTQNDVLTDALGRTYFAKLGLVDARNPLATGVWLALQAAGAAPIYFVGVPTDDVSGHLIARAVTESRRDLYAFAPLTSDLSVAGAYKLEWEQLADPTYALTNGVPQLFRMVLASTALPVDSTIAPSSVTGVAEKPTTTTNTGLKRTLVLTGTPTLNAAQVVAGDLVTIGLVPAGGSWATRRGTHTVSHLNKNPGDPASSTTVELELLPGTSRWNDSATDASGATEILITDPAGNVKLSKLASLQIDDGGGPPNGVLFSMKAPTVQGGPWTIAYAAGATTSTPVITITGFAISIKIDSGVTTHNEIIAAVNSHPTLSQLMTASLVGTSAAQTAPVVAADVAANGTVCSASVAANDDLYVWLYDATTKFLTWGVKVGDVVQVPIDPNDYSPGAFGGVVYSYPVAQVISENRVAVQVIADDSPSADNELPHLFNRHIANHYIDNETGSTASALRYRIVRALTTDDQVLALIAQAQSLRSKRATLVWPDRVDVTDLKDGSLPRSTPTVRTAAASQPGWALACVLAGVLAGLPVQHGVTGLGLPGIKKLYHSTKFFRAAQLSKLSDGGLCVFEQKAADALIQCLHQLTTDTTAIETGEISVVRNIDYVSIVFQEVVEPFLGQWNVLPETLSAILTELNKTIVGLKENAIARIGPKLVSGEIVSLKQSDVAANRVTSFANLRVANPLNGVDLHLVF